jgi:AcrR family transcriptional regulator
MSGMTGRPLRADAARNRDKLLDAATRLFIEQGLDATVDAIAKEAGVGPGTVYRHFPSREALIEAAYRSELDAVCDAAATLLATESPDNALRAWMDKFIDYMTKKIGMADVLRMIMSSGATPYAHSRERLNAAIELLLRATAKAGVTRSDAVADDVLMTLSGIATTSGAPSQQAQAHRMLDLLLDGLRYQKPALPAEG